MWLRIGGVAAAVLLVTALASVPAGPAGATSHPVRVGRVPQPGQGAVKLAPLPRNTEIRVDVSLQPRDPAALAAYARAVSTPGSDLYRRYLAPGAFAGTYGPIEQAITTVEQALRAAGLRPGRISGNHLSIPVRATAAQLSAAFSTSFQQYQESNGRVAYANDAAPLIADSAAPYVQGVVGLDDLYVPTPTGATRPSIGAGPTPVNPAATPAVASGGPQPCQTAVTDGEVDNAYTANQLASAYGFSSLYSAGDLGGGQTVALLEFQGYSTSDISAYESCYGEHTSITTVDTDGGPAANSGVGEADGDIEDVSGLAPDANIVVYQAPNTKSAWFDNWNTAVSQDAAKVISISWGLCEPFDGSVPQVENTILEEAAAQGQTFLASAGDAGSEDCLGPHGEDDNLAVDDPAAQPYVTGVGGTQWTSTGPPPAETAWNDGVLQCSGPADCFGAGGGGVSEDWTMPDYQTDAAPPVGVISGDSSGTPCGAPAGQYCREVPDVSALAGPYPFLFYIGGSWEDWGGTSFASPLWAALIALSDASSACDGEPIGFANPTLYSIAGSDPGAFNDITSGNNDITGANGGLYPALTGYDMATGLGSPNGAALPGKLCLGGTADGIAVTNPGPQTTYLGQSVNLQLAASDTTQGQTLSYGALGLPQGLSLDPATGVISGAVTAPGLADVVIVAKATDGASGSTAFTWSVPPSITSVRPAYGPAAGNTKVGIFGSGLTGTTQVRFGANQATTFTVNKAGTKVTAYSPSGTGSVGLTVTGPSGTSLPVTFEYGPTITGVVPASGPPGTKVTIKGTDLAGATVSFSDGVGASIITDSTKKITVDVPSGATTGPITVTTVGGTATSPIFDVT
jgi:subtilase family serine protease